MRKLISILLLLSLLTGCNTQTESSDKLNIITTYYPYQLVVEEISGGEVEVMSIYPEDSDAHSYELTPKQMIDLQEADLIIITSPEEDQAIYDSLNGKVEMLILDEEHTETEANHDHDEESSHSWLSPHEMEISSRLISEKLSEIDSANKAVYQGNYSALATNLEALDLEYQKFGQEQTKPIVATHDAYAFLTQDYGIEFVTLYGQHHDDEPTTKEVIATVDLVRDNQIKTIFVEQGDLGNKIIRQIADETTANVETLYTLETESSTKSFSSISEFYEYNLEMFKLGQN